MEHSSKLPGVTLYLVKSELKQAPGADGNRHATLHLSAKVEDTAIWDRVVEKVNGLRIYTVSDLATALIEVTQMEAKEALEKSTAEKEKLQQENQRLLQANSLMRAQLEKVKSETDRWAKGLDTLLLNMVNAGELPGTR
jgi:FtsZ-binding cell division protein ZapB